MLSPAARHRQRVLAAKAAAAAPATGVAAPRPVKGPEASAYQLLLAQLGGDIARLKDIQSVEAKIELKRELIANYADHVRATLKAGHDTGKAVQDEIVATMMIWAFDVGAYDEALDVAAHVLRFGLAMPEHMRRNPATFVTEEVAEAALAAEKQDNDFPLGILDRVKDMTAGQDMPDQVRAKLYKARARMLVRRARDIEEHPGTAPAGGIQAANADALESYRRALKLDRNAGVKKDIEQLERKVQPATS